MRIQMDSRLKTLLIKANGVKTSISCREICEQFGGNVISRLRIGIDSGADLSTIEVGDDIAHK